MDVKTMFSLEGKKGFITGSTRGIGKTLAQAFIELGADVAILGTNYDMAKTVAEELGNGKSLVLPYQCNVTDPESVNKFIADFERDYGTIDFAINNAGIFTEGSQDNLSSEDFDRVMDLNVRGLFLVTRTLLPALRKSNGSIVNIASMNAIHPGFGTAHYDASKGAVAAYTASLAAETGLRVNALAPGLIDVAGLHGTELEKQWKNHSVKPEMMSPAELADIVVFLARSTGIYGQTILADNGYCLK